MAVGSTQLLTKENKQSAAPLLQWQHNFKTTISFSSHLYAQLNIEYYANETYPGHFAEGIFADIGLSYDLEKVKFRFDFKNFFNQDIYTLSSYGELSSVVSSWKLRPREFSVSVSWSF